MLEYKQETLLIFMADIDFDIENDHMIMAGYLMKNFMTLQIR